MVVDDSNMKKEIKIAFDKKSDFLEVIFDIKEGFWKDTEKDAIMVKVDMEGNIIGFSVTGVSALDHPLYLTLGDKDAKVSSLSFDEQRIFEESMKRNETLMRTLSNL